jgi:hypothetical protein
MTRARLDEIRRNRETARRLGASMPASAVDAYLRELLDEVDRMRANARRDVASELRTLKSSIAGAIDEAAEAIERGEP